MADAGQRSDTDLPLLARRRSVRSACGRTISRGDLPVGRHVTKNYKVRHRKIDAESCDDRDKLCDKYIGVLRKDNKGGGRKYYPKRPRSGEADVLLPTQRTAGFQAEGDLRVHRVGS